MALLLGIQLCHEILMQKGRSSLYADCLAEGNIGQILRVLKLIELVNRDQDRRGLTLLGQHDTFVVTLRARH